MQYAIEHVVVTEQIVGLGKIVSKVTIQLDLSGYLLSPLSQQFILRLQFVFQNIPYHFAQIYTLSDLDANRHLTIGAVTLLGAYTGPNDLRDIKVSITYIGESIQ